MPGPKVGDTQPKSAQGAAIIRAITALAGSQSQVEPGTELRHSVGMQVS